MLCEYHRGENPRRREQAEQRTQGGAELLFLTRSKEDTGWRKVSREVIGFIEKMGARIGRQLSRI